MRLLTESPRLERAKVRARGSADVGRRWDEVVRLFKGFRVLGVFGYSSDYFGFGQIKAGTSGSN